MKKNLTWITVFGIAFAFVESAVVVYLRSLYYPEGFGLPLKMMSPDHRLVEAVREASTVIMLVSAGMLAGKVPWERFGYFMIAFGVWDIFYYVWLKFLLNWPRSFFDWDILFLLPVPWIGPVVAPVVISLLMIAAGVMIGREVERSGGFRPPRSAFMIATLATLLVLYSFTADTDATLHLQTPHRYNYFLFVVSIILYGLAFVRTFFSS